MPHTPIDHLLPETPHPTHVPVASQTVQKKVSPVTTIQDGSSPLPQIATTQPVPPKPAAPASVPSYGKESSPAKLQTETAVDIDQPAEVGEQSEVGKETQKKQENPKIRLVKDTPDIDTDAAKSGLAPAPSVMPFPSLYDVKVPLLSDEQIEEGLHASPVTGKRWLAEMGRYILWQAHIQLKRVGNKVVRYSGKEDPSFFARVKRIMWM